MTDRATKVILDFTPTQIIDALRTAGWAIPLASAVDTLKIANEGARVTVTWTDTDPEPPPP